MALVNPQQDPTSPNRRDWRAAEIPAANGQASAMGLARLYAALAGGGELEGVRLMSPSTVARMTTAATHDGRRDMFLGFVDSWGMGVALNRPGFYGSNPRAFGHSGWGGSFGCADPDAGVAIGYVCNQMGPDLVGDPRTGSAVRVGDRLRQGVERLAFWSVSPVRHPEPTPIGRRVEGRSGGRVRPSTRRFAPAQDDEQG